jgi:hypothetical protein
MQPFIVKQVDDTYDNKSGLTSSGDNWQHTKKASLRILMLKQLGDFFQTFVAFSEYLNFGSNISSFVNSIQL